MDSINLDITIGKKAGTIYPVSARYEPLGSEEQQRSINLDAEPLAGLLQWAEQSIGARSGNVDMAEALGHALYQALFGDRLGEFLRAARQDAQGRDSKLRVRLSTDDLDMLSVPWEFLFDPDSGHLLATDQSTPLVRYLSRYRTFGRTQPLKTRLPLRMLMVVPAVPDLDVQNEIDRVRTALEQATLTGTLIELNVLGGPDEIVSLQRLLDHLQEDAAGYDILHFSGHGDTMGGRGNLRFNSEDGDERWVDSGTFARALKRYTQPAREHPLRLVVLSACEGGVTAPEAYGTRSLLGMAPALIQNGIAAVIAMQYPILDSAALIFSRALYRALTIGPTAGQVDLAVTDGRTRLSVAYQGHRSFATPVLFTHAADATIFDLPLAQAGLDSLESGEPAAWTELDLPPADSPPSNEELTLLSQLPFVTPTDVQDQIESTQQLLRISYANLNAARQQKQELGRNAPPDLQVRIDRERVNVQQYTETLAHLTLVRNIAQRARVPAQMLFQDYLTGNLNNAVLELFMDRIPGTFIAKDVVEQMRQDSPLYLRRLTARLLGRPKASDTVMAKAIRPSIEDFVRRPIPHGYARVGNGRYRKVI